MANIVILDYCSGKLTHPYLNNGTRFMANIVFLTIAGSK